MRDRESAPSAGAVLLAMPSGENDDALLWSPVAGRPLLAWSLAALRAAPQFGPIALVVPQPRLDDAARLIAAEGIADTSVVADLTPQPPLPQGEGEAEVIVLHDAARPFMPAGHLAALVTMAAESGVAVSAEPVKETIKRVAQGRVVETLARDELAQLIPPLAVRADVLPRLQQALAGRPLMQIMGYVAAALAAGHTVRTVQLAGPSLAVTSPEDLAVAEALLGGRAS